MVATNIRRIRKRRGLSQEELGFKAGLHQTYIGAIERAEENITLHTLDRVAKALGVRPVELLKS